MTKAQVWVALWLAAVAVAVGGYAAWESTAEERTQRRSLERYEERLERECSDPTRAERFQGKWNTDWECLMYQGETGGESEPVEWYLEDPLRGPGR